MRMIACTALVLLATIASSAEIYRYTDAQGNVSFSDRPLVSNAEPVLVVLPRSSRTSRTSAGETPEPAAATPAPPPDALAADPASEPSPQALAEQRTRNCTLARERQQRYAEAHRLYRSLPNGEREYLSSAQIDEARAQAASDVTTWCS